MSATNRTRADGSVHVRHADDFYRTPAWATETIVRYMHMHSPSVNFRLTCDPCAGDGAILDVVRREIPGAHGYGFELDRLRSAAGRFTLRRDSLDTPKGWTSKGRKPTCILMNPPYKLAMPFVLRALREVDVDEVRGGTVIALLRLNWLAAQSRVAFHREYPSDVYVLPKRPSFTGDGRTDGAEYAWFVWSAQSRGNRWFILDGAKL